MAEPTIRCSLHRPGFRVPVTQDRQQGRDAYAAYETGLVNRYKVGDGDGNAATCYGSWRRSGRRGLRRIAMAPA